MKINNYDSNDNATVDNGDSSENSTADTEENDDQIRVDPPKYYSGMTAVHTAQLVIDQVKPFHCSVESDCTDNMLDRGPPTTKSVSCWMSRSHAQTRVRLQTLAFTRVRIRSRSLSLSCVTEYPSG